MRGQLDERGLRLMAAAEARAAGYGGIAAVARATGIARSTIGRGLADLDQPALPPGQVRRTGTRYARSAGVAPGSDEELMLQAMSQASFSLFRVGRPHEIAGLLVRDLMREEGLWLVDENLERTAPVGLTLAMRVSRPETFAMTCGVMVPVDAPLIETVFDEVQGRVRGEPAAIANDRRFATAIYRIAVMSGIMDQIGSASSG